MTVTMEDMKSATTNHLESLCQRDSTDFPEDLIQHGALIIEEEQNLSVFATIKLHWRALLICSASFTAGLAFGYDTVVNGASIAMPSFLLYFGAIGPKGPYLPSIWTSLWTAMSALCQAIGAFAAGFIADRFGRKWPASASGLLTLCGTAMQYYAHSRGLLLAGKMVTGFGIGIAMAAATSYASEMAPLKLRAPIQSALVLFTVFMQGVALGVVRIFVPNVQEQAFRNVFAIQWAVGSLLIITFALAPESAVFLITNGRIDQARKVMARLYGANDSVEARLAYLVNTIRLEQAQKDLQRGTYVECFRGKNLRRTLTVMFLYTSPNIGGAAFLAQSIYFLIIAGLPAIHSFDVSIGGFGLAVIIIFSSWFMMNHVRRRLAFLAGCIINFLFMLTIGCLYYAPGTGPLWGIAVLMNLLISLQTSLLQAMGWPIAAELSSLRLRAKTLSIAVISQTFSTWLTVFTVPYMYNVDSGNLGARTGFVFAGASVLLIIGAFYLVPDTQGLTTEQIDRLYDEKVEPRHFQKRAEDNHSVPVEA